MRQGPRSLVRALITAAGVLALSTQARGEAGDPFAGEQSFETAARKGAGYADGDHGVHEQGGAGTAQAVFHVADGVGRPYLSTLGPISVRGSSTYQYDHLGRLIELTDRKGLITVARWKWQVPLDGVPRLSTFWRGATAVTAVHKIDSAGRVVGEDPGLASAPTTAIAGYTSTDAANGYVATAFKQGKGGGSGGWGTGTTPSWREYGLDGRSNWLTRTAGAGSLAVTTTLNLIDGYQTFGATATYEPDGALKTLGNESYLYNVFGEVSEVQVGLVRKRYRYDGLGRRVGEQVITSASVPVTPYTAGSQETRYAFDGPSRVMRWLPGQSAPEITLDGDGLDQHIVRIAANGTKHYFHQDRASSVYLVSDASGNPAEWSLLELAGWWVVSTAWDGGKGVLNGFGVPGTGDGPTFGHDNAYGLGILGGSALGLGVDRLIIGGGSAIAGMGGVCILATGGACSFVGVGMVAVGSVVAAAGVGLSAFHAYKFNEGLNYLRRDAGSGGQSTGSSWREKAAGDGGRAANRLKPDPSAQGAHSTFKRDPTTGKVTGHAEWQPNPRNPSGFDQAKRVDTQYANPHTHHNKATGQQVPTPHAHDKSAPGGVRPARPDELPR